MAVIKTFDLARMTTATTGTGTITLGSAATVNGVLYLTFAQAGIADGDVVIYTINDATGGNSEVGYGTYTSAGTTLTRTVLHSTNSDNAINLSGSATVALCALAENLMLGAMVPQGRLTLSAATPVMSTTVTGSTTVYYALYTGNLIPIYNGAFFINRPFVEMSQATTDTTKSPAAVGTFNSGSITNVPACYDYFVWMDGTTMRCTRGPGWSKTSTVTITNASPGVVTWTSHGLSDGFPVWFTTTGALPTGVSANTVYYVTVVDANSFKLSTTLANQLNSTFVNTSSAGSGTHTGNNNTTARGTGAGTSELQMVNGILTNANAISNGPGANLGTYVGTIACNTSSTIDFIYGTTASNGGMASFNVWNTYNRRIFSSTVVDSAGNYTDTVASWKVHNKQPTYRQNFVVGLVEDGIDAVYVNLPSNGSGQTTLTAGLNTAYSFGGMPVLCGYGASSASGTATLKTVPGLGANYVTGLDYTGGGTTTFFQYDSSGKYANGISLTVML